MVDIELAGLVPEDKWQKKWDALVALHPWLKRKLDRERILREHYDYLARYVPEFSGMEPGVVIDLGPGAGMLLEIAAEKGHEAIGIDSTSGDGGMGDEYTAGCELLHERQGLNVIRCGGEAFFKRPDIAGDIAGRVALVNSRGSLEQIFSKHMGGPPHHLHHDCSKLTWHVGDSLTRKAVRRMFSCMDTILRPDGIFVIHGNGSANTEEADEMLREISAEFSGLLLLHSRERMHKWIKRRPPAPRKKATDDTADASRFTRFARIGTPPIVTDTQQPTQEKGGNK